MNMGENINLNINKIVDDVYKEIIMEDIAVIGGDLITVKLVKELSKTNKVIVFGLEYADELRDVANIVFADSLKEAVENNRVIVAPMPLSVKSEYITTVFSKQKIKTDDLKELLHNKILFAGDIWESTKKELEEQNTVCVDVLSNNELKIFSSIITAEGVLGIAIQETITTIHGLKVLVMGFGRAGKMIAKTFNAVGAKVSVEARKAADLAWIDAYNYEKVDLKDLESHLGKFDLIINTIPANILDNEKLKLFKRGSVLINLPTISETKIDIHEANKLGVKYIWASSLPQLVAPVTYAEIIKKVIFNHLEGELS